MYSVKLKKGTYYYGKSKSRGGDFDLDRWLLEFLHKFEALAVTVSEGIFNFPCDTSIYGCGDNNLILKSGATIKTLSNNKNLFNLEEYVFSILKYHGVLVDADWEAYCCAHKPKLHLFKSVLYFNKSDLKIHSKNGNLHLWIKSRMDYFTGNDGSYTSITFNDLPCINC